MSEASESKGMSMPKWNGKSSTCARYLDQFEAVAEYYDGGDALDPVLMANCPTKGEYEALVAKANPDDNDKMMMKLYRANKRLCAIYVIGQESNHGLAQLKNTKTADFPQGLIHEVIAALTKKHRPKDVSAEIRLEAELKTLKFKFADDFYNQVVDVCSRYECTMSETALIKLLASKVESQVFVSMILKHLAQNPNQHNFEELCDEITEIQRLSKTNGVAPAQKPEREVSLQNVDTGTQGHRQKPREGTVRYACGYCGEQGHKRSECTKRKAEMAKLECKTCGRKGHVDKDCWKAHPEKAPQWFKDKAKTNNEASGSNIEIMLSSVEEEQDFA